MMAGNPNYWSMNDMHPQSNQLSNSQFVYGSNDNNNSSSVTSVDSNSTADHHRHEANQDFPVRSWSHLLLEGLASGEEERFGASLYEQQKKLENWEDQQVLDLNSISDFARSIPVVDVNQEVAQSNSCQVLNYDDDNNNNNFFNFCGGKPAAEGKINHHQNQEISSECNSTSTSGITKKARVQQSSRPALKKPFGYIRFLQGQIEALSSPYMRNASVNSGHHHHSDSQRRGVKNLRSRGLCLVPVSSTENVGNDMSADYWAPAAFGGGF